MFNRIRSIRKRWFVVAAAVALLSVGLVGGTVLAAGASPGGISGAFPGGYDHHEARGGKGGANADVLARVAEIVGIEQETLEDAFKTAWDEQADAKFDAHIDTLVADETLTQEQGDDAKTWFDGRPAQSGPIAWWLAHTSDADRVSSALERMVSSGKATQEEADALAAWHDDRPDFLPEQSGKRHGKRRGHHHDHDRDDDGNGA